MAVTEEEYARFESRHRATVHHRLELGCTPDQCAELEGLLRHLDTSTPTNARSAAAICAAWEDIRQDEIARVAGNHDRDISASD